MKHLKHTIATCVVKLFCIIFYLCTPYPRLRHG